MDWYAQQLLTAERAAAGTFSLNKRCVVFEKGALVYPSHVTTGGRRRFLFGLLKKQVFSKKRVLVDIC